MLNVKIKGIKNIKSNINKMQVRANNLEKPLRQTGDFVIQEIYQNFQSEGARFGHKWTPRKNKRNTKPLLVDTGAMRDSFNKQVSKKSVVVYNELQDEYYKFHQLKEYGMWRPMILLKPPLKKEITRKFKQFAIDDYLLKGIK